MTFHRTAQRLWRSLTPEERLDAAAHFWRDPPADVAGTALGAIAQARHMRPQAARALAPEAQARILATILDPGEAVAAALLVSLHLGTRRSLLASFLDALGLPHEAGLLKDGAEAPPVGEDAARKAVLALGAFPPPEVATYLNTLWLQDPERWHGLEKAAGSGHG